MANKTDGSGRDLREQSRRSPAVADESADYIEDDEFFDAAARIAERDSELLRRLAR